MINILLSTYDFDNEHCFHKISKYVKPRMNVLILPLTHDESYYKNEALFNSLYDYEKGQDYNIICKAFGNYGIDKPHVSVLNPFLDNMDFMRYKIKHSDILFITGGNPITFMNMLDELDILDDIKSFESIVMGSSAGAMVQMEEFMTYPNEEGYSYAFYKGLGFVEGFDVMVHRDVNDEIQNKYKEKSIHDRPNIPIINVRDGECEILESHHRKHKSKLLDMYIEDYNAKEETLIDKIKIILNKIRGVK